MYRTLTGPAKVPSIFLCGLFLWAANAVFCAAQERDDITLRLGATTGQPGGSVEVSVMMEAGDVLPESIILFLAYDPAVLTPIGDYYERVLRNPLSGEPILDNEGNSQFIRSALNPSENLRASGKAIDFETYGDAGVIGVSIQGLNQLTIAPGALLSVAFAVDAGVPDGTLTEVLGVSTGAEVLIPDGSGSVTAVATSAARSVETSPGEFEVVDVSYRFVGVDVGIGCIAPAAPSNLTATQNRPDMVFLTWNAVSGAGIEYRVYRGTTNNPAAAAPIGEGWQAAVSFEDITARVPETVPGEGCNPQPTVEVVRYYYWVQARSEEGCESNLSATPVQGFRTASKVGVAGALTCGLIVVAALAGRRVAPGTRRRA